MNHRADTIVIFAQLLLSQCCSSPAAPAAQASPAAAGRFQVTTSGAGVAIGGILFRPDIPANSSRPAVIVVHGYQPNGTNGAATVEARAKRLSEDGYIALAMSMRGWPPSGGSDDCGLRQPDDVVQVVNWLKGEPGVDAGHVGLIGFSQGGQVVLLAAARGAPVQAVVAYFPVTDIARWKETTSFATIPDYITQVCEPGGVSPRSPVAQAALIASPVLLVHGDADTRVPTEQSLLLEGRLKSFGRAVDLRLIPGAQHGFTAAEESIAWPIVDEFLATRLGRRQ